MGQHFFVNDPKFKKVSETRFKSQSRQNAQTKCNTRINETTMVKKQLNLNFKIHILKANSQDRICKYNLAMSNFR